MHPKGHFEVDFRGAEIRLPNQHTFVERRHLACNQTRIPNAHTSIGPGGTRSRLITPAKWDVATYAPHINPPAVIRLPKRSSAEMLRRGSPPLRFWSALATTGAYTGFWGKSR
jgi:hypothetical protein